MSDYTNDNLTSSTSTYSAYKYDRTTDSFLRWIRYVPLESDAVNNLPKELAEYDKDKTLIQRIRCLFI